MSEAKRQAAITAVYDALHKDKLGAHWLWCVIEKIAAGQSEEDAMDEYGYYARALAATTAPAPTEPVALSNVYVEARECSTCNHAGINDASETDSTCNECGWIGHVEEDQCPGCSQQGTMTAACPKCGGAFRFLTDATIPLYATPPGAVEAAQPEAEPVALFLLHAGKIDGDGEQADWDVEADSGRQVDAFCKLYPGQTVKLYPGPPPTTEATPPAPAGDARDEIRRELLNTPDVKDFATGVVMEALHQRERWGSEHDAGKMPADWFWLVGYLAGKALHAQTSGNTDKALHHTISTAAALANWHGAITGTHTAMRPGIDDAAILAAKGGKL